MNKQNLPPQAQAVESLNSITRSNEFLEARSRMVGIEALRTTALVLADERRHGGKYENEETRKLRLIASIPGWYKSQKYLDANRENMNRSQVKEALKPVIKLNHILREIIDNEQFTRVGEIIGFTEALLTRLGASNSDIKYASGAMRQVVDGMRHEIVAESVISSLDGTEEIIDPTDETDSLEREYTGKDIVFIYRGSRVAIDVKASQARANEANQFNSRTDQVALWSGIRSRDFGEKLLPSREQLDDLRDYYEQFLDDFTGNSSQAIA